MCFHASYSNINAAIIFTVHFTMNIHMEKRHLRVQQCPVVKTLMEGTGFEVFWDQVIWIKVCLIDCTGCSPYHERVISCPLCEITCKKRCVYLSLMDAYFLVVLFSSSLQFLGMRSSKKYGSFVYISYVFVFQVIFYWKMHEN